MQYEVEDTQPIGSLAYWLIPEITLMQDTLLWTVCVPFTL